MRTHCTLISISKVWNTDRMKGEDLKSDNFTQHEYLTDMTSFKL